jgi:uncharacterized membrane protein YeaQ/YmgE (transglycosylase-associated protein family)
MFSKFVVIYPVCKMAAIPSQLFMGADIAGSVMAGAAAGAVGSAVAHYVASMLSGQSPELTMLIEGVVGTAVALMVAPMVVGMVPGDNPLAMTLGVQTAISMNTAFLRTYAAGAVRMLLG